MNTITTCLNLLLLALFYLSYCYPRWHTTKEQLFLKTVLFVYATGVVYVTLLPWYMPIPFFTFDGSMTTVNLVPFLDLLEGHGGAWKELILNMIMMVPFGMLVPMIYHRNGKETVLLALLVSFCIEVLQYVSVGEMHSSDVTDLFSNTFGGAIGFAIYFVTKKPALRLIHFLFPPIAYKAPPRLILSKLCVHVLYATLLFLLLLVSMYLPFQWLN